MNQDKIELLAPAGDMEKLKTAIHFGADAVYFAGKQFGLRAFAKNFEDLSEPIAYAHLHGKKAYVTVNIYARNYDLDALKSYFLEIEKAGADGVIISDLGVMQTCLTTTPSLEIHVSTQANTTNLMSALAYAEKFNAKRVVLARELSLKEVKEISDGLKKVGVETEIFVHGAMCISYSGRCLLSNYLTGRDSNRGACVQACRFAYSLVEADADNNVYSAMRKDEHYPIAEDERGTYILNSKDMCLITHLDKVLSTGVKSLKIEGRMKSPYYLATVINAYRRKIDELLSGKKDKTIDGKYLEEVCKSSHREFTTGFLIDDNAVRQSTLTTHQTQDSEFLGVVKGVCDENGKTLVTIEMRNRFKVGDTVEFLSPTAIHNSRAEIKKMTNLKGEDVTDAKRVQEILQVEFDASPSALKLLQEGDIIRTC